MRTPEEEMFAGGWKCLCAGVMLQAVERLRSVRLCTAGSKYHSHDTGGIDKESLKQRAQAQIWMAGGTGVITFEDCCESLGVDPGRARQMLQGYLKRYGS